MLSRNRNNKARAAAASCAGWAGTAADAAAFAARGAMRSARASEQNVQTAKMSLEPASRAYLSFTEAHPGSSAPVNHGTCLVAVLIGAGFGCVHHAERTAAVGPEKHHGVFAGGNIAQLALDVVVAGDGFAVDFQDHVAAGDTGAIGRA